MNEIRPIEDGKVVEKPEAQPIGQRMDGISVPPLDMDAEAVSQVRGLENDSDKRKYAKEIKTLISWARTQSDKHDPVNLKWILRNLQMKLGTPPLAEKMITRAARYAYLDLESKSINDEKLSLME